MFIPWGLELPNNVWYTWNSKVFYDGVWIFVERNVGSSWTVSEFDMEALDFKNSSYLLKNVLHYSCRDSRLRCDNIVFWGRDWCHKINWVSKDRNCLLADFLFKLSPIRELASGECIFPAGLS